MRSIQIFVDHPRSSHHSRASNVTRLSSWFLQQKPIGMYCRSLLEIRSITNKSLLFLHGFFKKIFTNEHKIESLNAIFRRKKLKLSHM